MNFGGENGVSGLEFSRKKKKKKCNFVNLPILGRNFISRFLGFEFSRTKKGINVELKKIGL